LRTARRAKRASGALRKGEDRAPPMRAGAALDNRAAPWEVGTLAAR
jgi:hypothetical protein